MSLTPIESTEISIYYRTIYDGSGLALEAMQSHDTGSAHSNLHHSQSHLPFGNIELLVISILLLSLPIMIYLAYRYGKKMGRKETNSPNLVQHYFGNEPFKKNSEEESTCSASDIGKDKENEKGQSTESSPALSNISQPTSVRQESSQFPEQDKSSSKGEESMRQLMLNEEHEIYPEFTLKFEPESGNGAQNQTGAEIFEEKLKLHTTEEQIEKKHGTFGVRLEKKNGQLHKVETTEVRTVYSHETPEPEENAKRLASNFYQKAPIFNTLSRINGPTHASSYPGPAQNSAMLPYLEKTRSDPTNNLQTRLALPFAQSPEPVLNKIIEDAKKDSDESRDFLQSSQEGSKGKSKDTTKDLERLSSVQKLVEEYDLPDETGKFNKIFKAAELIGEGSFGEVYKVVHRVDGKIYAVKKVKLKLGRFEDMQKESKVFREVFAMTDLHHPNIVRYSTCWVEVELGSSTDEATKPEKKTSKVLSLEDISENEDSVSHMSHNKTQTQDEDEEEDELSEYTKQSDSCFEFDRGTEEPSVQPKHQKDKPKFNKQNMMPKKKKSKSNFGFQTLSRSMRDDEEEDDMSSSSQSISMMSNYSMSRIDPKFSGCRLYLYIQMEYCPGLSLRTYLDNTKREISRPKVLAMFRKLLEGVRVIHSRGILHRDLKPANIFLDDNENVKIGDFGLASLENMDETKEERPAHIILKKSHKMHSMKIGTPMYTSPEQESGGYYDQKTDIYSLGLILCEMLVLFGTHHERYQFLNKIRTRHELPEEFMRKYPKESELIIRMTEKYPNLRPSAEQLITEFEKLIDEARPQVEQ